MSGQLIVPPDYIEVNGPLVFLAGPIQGASRWQDEAIKLFQSASPTLHIASPRKNYLQEEFVYEKQVNWETHYLNRAARQGVIMFWLAKERQHNCDRAYAQTSRFELAEWKVKHERDGVKLVVGIEPEFTGERYIKLRLAQDCPDLPICSTIEDTCRKVVAEINK